MGWLGHRVREPEVMDQPGLSPARHAEALEGLARINWLSRTSSTLFANLYAHQRRRGQGRLRLLDVASGGGDVAIRLWQMARERGLDWQVAGCDFSPVAIEQAQARARQARADVSFFQHDAVRQPLPGPRDAVVCSLFLHHLEDGEAVALLRAMAELNGGGPSIVLVSDLRRCVVGLLLAHVVGRVVTRSRVVHVDGPRSVRAAFTIPEAEDLARRAGLDGATVRPTWPCRWLLTWERP